MAQPSGTKGSGNLKWVIAITVALATFMEVLDDTSVSVALTQIGGNLSAGQDEVTWIVTAQLVAKAVVLPIAGFLATVIGRSRFFSGCLLMYGATSLLCGLAPTIEILVLLRVIQGMSGGMLSPLAQAILTDSFPPRERGIAFATYGIATVVAPTVGPTLGGYIVDNLSWNWVFFVNVPVAILTAVLISIFVVDTPEMDKERARKWKGGLRVDYIGLSLLAIGLGGLQVVLSRGERLGWLDSSFIGVLAIVAVSALIIGILWEFMHDEPVIELRLLYNRTFASAMLVMFSVGLVLFGSSTQLPLFLQSLLGYTATLAGFAISPGGVAVLLLMPVVGFLSGKIQARWLIAFGLAVSGLALFNYTQVLSSEVSFANVAWARIYQSIGLAFLFVPINVAAYVGIPKSKTNQAATITNLAFSLGGSFGVAAVTTLVTRQAQYHQSRLVGNLTQSDTVYQQTLENLSGTFQQNGGTLAEAAQRAQAVVYGSLLLQANVLAYIDAFFILAVACFVIFPLVFVMRGNKPGADDAGAAAG